MVKSILWSLLVNFFNFPLVSSLLIKTLEICQSKSEKSMVDWKKEMKRWRRRVRGWLGFKGSFESRSVIGEQAKQWLIKVGNSFEYLLKKQSKDFHSDSLHSLNGFLIESIFNWTFWKIISFAVMIKSKLLRLEKVRLPLFIIWSASDYIDNAVYS